jgi:tetratricopeptide (TPR) repeat protein
LRLERNYGEAIRLLQARLAQPQFDPQVQVSKAFEQVALALTQRLAGDTAGAKDTAEQARNALESLCKSQPDNSTNWAILALANAAIGEKELALMEAERAIMLYPRAKDAMSGLPVKKTWR